MIVAPPCHIKGFVNTKSVQSIMALKEDWKLLLKAKYSSYKVEVQTYLDTLEIVTSSMISASKIYDAIKDVSDINENLKKLYKEALFGNDTEVRARIKNRITNFQRNMK